MNETTKDLLRSLKATASSRFNASKRLSHVDSRLTALTAFTSAFIIALTILPKFIELPHGGQNWLELTTIALSIIILASSLLQNSSNFAVKSELFHRSALEIQQLKRELQFKSSNLSEAEFDSISKKYNDILQIYSINHEDVDFYRHQVEYHKDYTLGWVEKVSKRAQIWCAYMYPSVILATLTVFLVALTFAAICWPVAQPPYANTPPSQSESSNLKQLAPAQ